MYYLELEIENEGKKEKQRIWVEEIGKKLWIHWKGRTFVYNPFYFSDLEILKKDEDFKEKNEILKEKEKGEKRETESLNQNLEKDKKIKGNKKSFIFSPIYGRIIKVFVQEGESIKKGHSVLVLESMKMEHNVKSHLEGRISKVYVQQGDQIKKDEKLILIE